MRADFYNDFATIAALAAVRAAFGHEFLTEETDTTVSAIAAFDKYNNFVFEHKKNNSVPTAQGMNSPSPNLSPLRRGNGEGVTFHKKP